MVAKFSSKTHLKNITFPFFQPFRPRLPTKFVKSAHMIQIFFFQNAIWVSFNAEFDAIFESVEKA
jgi:hypothetical protein